MKYYIISQKSGFFKTKIQLKSVCLSESEAILARDEGDDFILKGYDALFDMFLDQLESLRQCFKEEDEINKTLLKDYIESGKYYISVLEKHFPDDQEQTR